ncbi:thiamine-phosphate diphosphorylase [Halorientalis sp. IM1011]|uniref:thiamine phosphate synthase n=1 Tax=Halorientalis sp. IM1011 TaxID=1932360 RepID=UPI00097CCDCB|nr:thiamine phosphate synthase [Halorientalis sp. IM1011]AQL42747.1 thiamine-phosphate diphosphorylase [Halorientalis sp. IM1011]
MNPDTYLVTAEPISEGRSTTEIVEAAIAGGIDVVQLREKEMPARERYDLGLELRELTREAGVPLIVNDRIDLAAAVDADGVHLGDEDLPIAVAREQLGAGAVVGRSVSTPEAAREAERAGADYLGVGAVYPTNSKDTDPEGTEIGLDRIEAVAEAVGIPVVGIGGVKPDTAAAVIEAGADGVAVISAITAAEDPEVATRDLGAAVERGRSST